MIDCMSGGQRKTGRNRAGLRRILSGRDAESLADGLADHGPHGDPNQEDNPDRDHVRNIQVKYVFALHGAASSCEDQAAIRFDQAKGPKP
jgi:hypothetical protein